MSKTIYLDAPDIGETEKRYLARAVDTGYVSTAGPYVPKFEKMVAGYLGIKNGVSTQSGTAAIHMALHELGIGQGDEVIVPALTFVATVNPVVYVGATPVFADVDADTWTIDPAKIEKSVTKRTRAVIPVHFYGSPCDMSAIMKIAKKYDLYVIEDATESLGATYRGRHTGTFGDLGCLSFNGNKTITTGGGGMVVSPDSRKIEHIKFLINQARAGSGDYYHTDIGFNYRMTNIEAALGLAQMSRLDGFLTKKRRFNDIYRDEFKTIGSVRFQGEYPQAKSSRWLTCAVFESMEDAGVLQKELKAKNIPARRIFTPVVEFPPYRRYRRGRYQNSYRIYERGLCLPSSMLNSESDIRHVCKMIKEDL